jgi:hypothetical protein
MSAPKNDMDYKKKIVGNKTYIQCRNSKSTSPYYNGNDCTEWVSVNRDSISALCFKCVIITQQ